MLIVETQNQQYELLDNANSSYKSQNSFCFSNENQKYKNSFQDEIEQTELGFYQTTPVTDMSLFQKESEEEVEQKREIELKQGQQAILNSCYKYRWEDDEIDFYQFVNKNSLHMDMEIFQGLCFTRQQKNSHPLHENQQMIDRKQHLQQVKNKSQQRRFRVQKYLAKKAKRSFCKKISYQCRKHVADKRIRIKGRFVNKKQAQEMIKSQLLKQTVQTPFLENKQ